MDAMDKREAKDSSSPLDTVAASASGGRIQHEEQQGFGYGWGNRAVIDVAVAVADEWVG
jgi:hypothetical protein